MKIKRGFQFSACLLSLICCYSFENRNYTFRCHSQNQWYWLDYDYIRDEQFCDGNAVCNFYEDERFGCTREGNNACGAGKFACDGDCKNITVRCNTIKDCQDGTDELNCGDEINVKNCTSEDKFFCKDGLRCLNVEYTCDDRCNCFDCSDEGGNCSKSDLALMKECPHAYFRTLNGPQCFCPSNISSSSNSTFCSDITYCDSLIERQCDQRCIQFKTKVQCSCYEGYYPTDEIRGTHCKTKENFRIIYATDFEIKSLNNTSQKTSTILHGIANCTMLKASKDYVFYATSSHNNRGCIFKVAMNFGKAEKLIETNFPITSLAVDYIANNVYFTSNGSLSVCESDGQLCIQLKCCNITCVTLAPKSGWMFYMQRNTHRDSFCKDGYFLTRSNMDGSNETMRTTHCYMGKISMEIDESKNKLYLLTKNWWQLIENELQKFFEILVDPEFVNQHNYVELSGFDSLLHWSIEHFSFYNEVLFFTSRTRADIFYLSMFGSSHMAYDIDTADLPPVYLHDNTSSAASGLYVYNPAIQLSDENPCDNKSSCSGLCLLKPVVGPSKYFLNHSCLCDHFTPTGDNRWCSEDSEPAVGMVMVMCILALLLILLVAGTGYCILKKGKRYQYYLTLQPWRQSEQSQQMIIVRDQE